MEKRYDVALTFAGEDRKHAERLAELLKSEGYSVFYDKFEEAVLWGKNLYSHFSSIYRDQAKFCVMFISEHYARKLWTRHERESAQARAIEENQEYILPIRLDDSDVPGILKTVGILDLRETSIEEIHRILKDKLDTRTESRLEEIAEDHIDIGSSDIVLLVDKNGCEYFLPFDNAEWGSEIIKLRLIPTTPNEIAFLRSLRDRDQFSHRETYAFAMEEDAAWVSITDINQTVAVTQTVWEVVLELETNQNNIDFSEIEVNGVSPDSIAEMRANRILLDEQRRTEDDDFLHLFNWGGVHSQDLGQVLNDLVCPFPRLYQSIGHIPERFIEFAKLTAVLYLKLTNTVEDILKFELSIINSERLSVSFKGRRRRFYTNVEPAEIEVNGICKL